MRHDPYVYCCLALALTLVVMLGGCDETTPTATPIHPLATPVECEYEVKRETVEGAAYLDANGSGDLDPTDPPLTGATFVAHDTDGTVVREETGADGRASIEVTLERPAPGSEPSCSKGPAVLVTSMEPPPGYELVASDGAYLFRVVPGEWPLAEMPLTPRLGVAGADSIGDGYAPELGNAGYDVQHYELDLAIDPASEQITGTVTISAISTLDRLGRISLDLAGYRVDEVRASGTPTRFYRSPHKLYVELAQPVNADVPFSIEVDYTGAIEARPSRWRGPHVRLGLVITQTLDGPQVVARNQPDGARNWFPCNDHPLDKATYRIEVGVPSPLVAISNGKPAGRHVDAHGVNYAWVMDAPMATYLVGLAIGPYRRVEADPVGPVAIAHYLFASDLETGRNALAPAGEMMQFLSDCLGPYPFTTYGYVGVTPLVALETQSMVTLGRELFEFDNLTDYMVHEHVHQWFGNSVTPATWSDIWLNEGFATYFEFLWRSRDGNAAGCASWKQNTLWLEITRKILVESGEPAPLAWPEPEDLLGVNSYYKGAWVLHMLRSEIGDEAFFALLRLYYARFAGGNARSDDLRAMAGEVSGRDLASFFEQWLTNSDHPVIETTWTSRPLGNNTTVTVQVCQRQAERFSFPLDLVFSATDGRTAQERPSVEEPQTVITYRLPFAPDRLSLDPDLRLLAEIGSPEQVDALRPCTP